MSHIKHASVQEAWSNIHTNPDATLIDVREPEELAVIAAQKALVFPMSTLDPLQFSSTSGIDPAKPLYILCRSGARSMRVATALSIQGFSDLYNVTGGILAWEQAGLPIE